jgi:hypothetical protein
MGYESESRTFLNTMIVHRERERELPSKGEIVVKNVDQKRRVVNYQLITFNSEQKSYFRLKPKEESGIHYTSLQASVLSN